MKAILFLILYLLSFQFFSQIKIFDSITLEPIPYVEIYSESGDLICLSNSRGNINYQYLEIDTNKKKQNIFFNHISYISKKKILEDILKSKIILLNPKIFEIDNITIKAPKKQYKYLIINGYYRSYQINDNIIRYYIDGIVNYYIPLNSKKKVKKKILQSRFYENITQRKLDSIGNRVVEMSGVNIPTIPNNFKKNITVNNVNVKHIYNQIYMIDYPQEIGNITPLVLKSLGIKIIMLDANLSEYYYLPSDSTLPKNNLLYCKDIFRGYVKKSKKDSFIKVEGVSEFFVDSVFYVQNISEKNVKKYPFIYMTEYVSSYWRKIKSPFYKPLPESVEKALETTLTELKNIYED